MADQKGRDEMRAELRGLEKGQLITLLIDLRDEIERLRATLAEIRDMDYRGNRSMESTIAYKALGGCS